MPGTIMAIAAFLVGGGVSALHLGHPERIFGGFSNLQSGVTRELIAFVIIGIIMVVYLVTLYRKVAISKALAAIAVLGSVGTVIVFADSYLMPARPVWNTVLLPATYLASAAVLGLFTLNILAAADSQGNNCRACSSVGCVALLSGKNRDCTLPRPDAFPHTPVGWRSCNCLLGAGRVGRAGTALSSTDREGNS